MIDQMLKKSMSKFSNNFIKPYFWPIWGYLEAKTSFSKNSGSVMHNLMQTSITILSFEKCNNPLPRKQADRRTGGRTDRVTH